MNMRVWLLQGKQGDDPDGLEVLLRQWAQPDGRGPWQIDRCLLRPNLAAEVQSGRPDLLVLAEPSCPAGPWAAEVLAHGVGLVVATSRARAEAYAELAEQYPVCLVPLPPGVEALGLALRTARAAVVRCQGWQAQLEQLQQRLADRIVIERAKGILVQRLRIPEEEAYQRLRLLSRRQRRLVREVAQSLLDAQELLLPEAGHPVPPRQEDVWDPEWPVAPSERGA
jgi:AmiR/NasT family two-component response regulator